MTRTLRKIETVIAFCKIETVIAIRLGVKYPFNAMFRKNFSCNCNEGQKWMSCTVIIHEYTDTYVHYMHTSRR